MDNSTTISDDVKKVVKKKYKCPYCDLRVERAKLHIHIQNEHEDLIPEGFTALRVAFNTINHKTEGHCIICKKITDWDEDKGRYNRLCNNPACKEAYKKMCAERNQRIYGTDRLQSDPRYADMVQRKALEGRRISGKYTFADGGVIGYVGSYEKKFLEFMDTIMRCKSEDILSPGPTIKYMFQGEEHIYLPDFYYVPYDLIIEIKDGGSNPNNHPHRTGPDQDRLLAKEDAIKKSKEYNYVRVTNNDFGQLMGIMSVIKFNHQQNHDMKKVIRIHENMLNESYLINEKDIYYNKDKFDSGEINLCFITGHPGSGKSTMGRDMAKKNIEHYELDDLLYVADHFTMNNLKEYGDLIYSYFNGPGKRFYKTMDQVVNEGWNQSQYEGIMYPEFVHYAMNYAKAYKDTKFVLEGVWFYSKSEDGKEWFEPSEFKDYAFYIKGTSAIISSIRAAKRDASNDNGKANHTKEVIKQSIHGIKYSCLDEKRIKKFRDYFSQKSIKEDNDMVFEDMSGTIAAALAPTPTPHECNPNNYYIVQHPQNNVFNYSITKDPMQSTMYSVEEDKDGKRVVKSKKTDIGGKYLTFKIKDTKAAKELYDELALIESHNGRIHDDKIDALTYAYTALTESEILTPDQLMFDSRFELVKNPADQTKDACDKIYKYLKCEDTPTLMNSIEEQVNSIEKSIDSMDMADKVEPVCEFKIPGVDIIDHNDWENKINRAKEAESQGLVIMFSDKEDFLSSDAEECIRLLKEKYRKYQDLTADKRILSNQTASAIFGVDNEVLYTRILNSFINSYEYQKKNGEHPYEDEPLDIYKITATDDMTPYFIPGEKGNYTTSNLSEYARIKMIEEQLLMYKITKNPIRKQEIKENVIDLGWNPEIPFSKEAADKLWVRYETAFDGIEEIDARNLLNEALTPAFTPATHTSEDLKDKIVPVFVILSHGVKPHSKGIEWFTDSEWSHASMSFDSSLDTMYTFTAGIDNAPNKHHHTGFGIDTKAKYLERDAHMKVKVYALFVTPEQKAKMKDAVDWYVEHQDETSYSFKTIFNLFSRKITRRKKGNDKYKMICSQFVYTILTLANFKMRKTKDSTLISPADIDELADDARFYVVYQESLDRYNPDKVDALCYRLLPALPLEIYGIDESTGMDLSRPISAIRHSSNEIDRVFKEADLLLK